MTELTRPSQRRDRLIVLGTSLLVSLVVVLVVFPSQGLVQNSPDPYGFSAMGQGIARGEGFHGEILGRKAPLYPLFLGAIYWLFGTREWVVQLAQSLMLAGTALLAQDIGRRLYNNRTGLIAGLLCAVHPSLLRYVPDFHLEELLTFMVTLTLWASVVLYQRPRWRSALLFGVSLGLASLTKAVFLLYPVVFGLMWLWRLRTDRAALVRVVGNLAVVAAAMVVTIAPWAIRNYRLSGHLIAVSTGASDAFLRGFVFTKPEYATLREPPYTGAENEVNAWFRSVCQAQGTVWERNAVETDAILSKLAKEKLRQSPGDAIRKSVLGVFTFWYEMTSLKTSAVAGLIALVSWIFAALGFRRARREGRQQWLLLAPIIYLNLFLAVLLALGRYSVPVLPALTVLAAFGLDTVLARRAARQA
jgi:4-amino-4-deoxy-L-arabinose transferase-like glycosyltransferase